MLAIKIEAVKARKLPGKAFSINKKSTLLAHILQKQDAQSEASFFDTHEPTEDSVGYNFLRRCT